MGVDHAHGVAVEQLAARNRHAHLDDLDGGVDRIRQRGKRAGRRHHRLRQRVELDRDFGDHAQRAFAANEQAREVVAGAGLLGREMSRAIVTSENDAVAFGVAAEVFAKGGEILGFDDEINAGDIRYSIECQRRPCISPNNEIEVKIISRELGRSISAVEYVSPWA